MNEDGTMARRPELEIVAREHDLKIGTIADLIHYRVVNERTIEKISEGIVHTDHGDFVLHTYKDLLAGDIHYAMVKGDIDKDKPTLARVHLASTMRDLMTTQPNEKPSWNIQRCLSKVAQEGCGVVVLLANQETTAEQLANIDIAMGKKPRPIASGNNVSYLTVGLGSQILRDVGAGKLRLMGAAIKYNAISGFDLEVIEYIAP
jgi:3,4-dihydroxy 2-butanone 4-phosphate synthase/GTP cyclohydrolase II